MAWTDLTTKCGTSEQFLMSHLHAIETKSYVVHPSSSRPLCPVLPLSNSSSRTTVCINLLFLSSRPNPVTVARKLAYKKIRLACCFDCGRSERDCSCMPVNVRCNMDSPQRDIPLSAVSVNDCSATLRACKLSPWRVPFSVCHMRCADRVF